MKLMPAFLSLKSVPVLFWTAPFAFTIRPPLLSFIFLTLGLVIFGLGQAFIFAAGIGVSPWMVLAQGIESLTQWSIGLTVFLVSSGVLILWVPLRQIPGIGTIMNAIVVAFVIEYMLPFMPRFDSISFQILEAASGVFVTGIGTGIYLTANLGPGPRDGLMTGLQRITNYPIAMVRNALELSVVLIGWLIGGVVGIGTVLFALGIGPSAAFTMFILNQIFANKT
jgi:uncharacterized membrane protein YczE